MSLDWYLEKRTAAKHCVTCRCDDIEEVFWRNITHNVVPMWQKAGVYAALYEGHGKLASDIVESLEAGLTDMLERFEEYKKLDAPNKWGLAEHAIAFLWAVYRACQENLSARIRVSR